MGPDGRRISFVVEVQSTQQSHIDILELVQRYFRDVGIDLQMRPMERSLFTERQRANLQDATANFGAGGLGEILNPKFYIPTAIDAEYAIPWYYWYADKDDPNGIEPPEAVEQALTMYDELVATADPEQQAELMRQILASAAERFHTIGISLPVGQYGVADESLRNVPAIMPGAWFYPTPAPTNVSQWFLEGGEAAER